MGGARPDRSDVPPALRSELLIANEHACCICGHRNVQLHHINEDPSDNRRENLAVLCLDHHAEASAPSGMAARLRAGEIATYKRLWETSCRQRAERAARSRTAFFMVDYKNPDRLRQLFSQLSKSERAYAHDRLHRDLRDEDRLRDDQGFKISTEPDLRWSEPLEYFLSELRSGGLQPRVFRDNPGHPLDPLLPVGFTYPWPPFALYDLWCQVMARSLVVCRGAYDLDQLVALDEPEHLSLEGSLLSAVGRTRGLVHEPHVYETHPTSSIAYRAVGSNSVWSAALTLKTHYVYSITAATSLSNARENGLLLFRGVEKVRRSKRGNRHVTFSATPLILGVRPLQIP